MKKKFTLVFLAFAVIAMVSSSFLHAKKTLGRINGSYYSLDAASHDIKSAFQAAYRFGRGEEDYGLKNPQPAKYKRLWALNADGLTETIVSQPWFKAYRAGLAGFKINGMPGFLSAFDREMDKSDLFRNSSYFTAFTKKEDMETVTAEDHRIAVTKFCRMLGYDRSLEYTFRPLNRLLIANFVAPAEARGQQACMGMDKLTHYYHARLMAMERGVLFTLFHGFVVEFTEFFMGHHHRDLLLDSFSHWKDFHLEIVNGWPRLYSVEPFFIENRQRFKAGESTYEEWKNRVFHRPFGWGDLTANYMGAIAEGPSDYDWATIPLFCLLFLLSMYLFRRSKEN